MAILSGQLICGHGGLPSHGSFGHLLYAAHISMSCTIVIEWTGGQDLDICGFWSHEPSKMIGYSYTDKLDDLRGCKANWTNGPETVTLEYSGIVGMSGKTFEIHFNWYRIGADEDSDEQTAGGSATVRVTDQTGFTRSITVVPPVCLHRAATPSDPGIAISFTKSGKVAAILPAA